MFSVVEAQREFVPAGAQPTALLNFADQRQLGRSEIYLIQPHADRETLSLHQMTFVRGNGTVTTSSIWAPVPPSQKRSNGILLMLLRPDHPQRDSERNRYCFVTSIILSSDIRSISLL